MKKIYKLMWSLLLLPVGTTVYSQQCTANAPTNIQSYERLTVPSGTTMCFSQDLTFGDLDIQDGASIVVQGGATINAQYDSSILGNNSNITVNKNGKLVMALSPTAGTTLGNSNAITVDGDMVFKYDTSFLSNINLKINETGNLYIGETGGSGLSFNVKRNAFISNKGNIYFNSINFTNTNSLLAIYTFSNDSNVTFKGFADTGDTFVYIQNKTNGVMNFQNGYASAKNMVLTNCGVMNFNGPVNLQGGSIINSRDIYFQVSSFDFQSGSTKIENYGTMDFSPLSTTPVFFGMGASDKFYNEGVVNMDNFFFTSGTLSGPTVSNREGYVNLTVNPTNKHILSSVTGNINFLNMSGVSNVGTIFWNPPTLDPTVTFDCASKGTCIAPPITAGDSCPDEGGNMPKGIIHFNPNIIFH